MYPTEILPSTDFVTKLDMNTLMLKYPRLTLARQVSGTLKEYLEEVEGKDEKVLSMRIFSNSMYNLSMNLLGGLFHIEKHLPFLPKNEKACSPWDGNAINMEDYIGTDYFTETRPCFGIYFQVNDLDGLYVPYRKQFKSQEEFNQYKEQAQTIADHLDIVINQLIVGTFESSKQPTEINARTKVNHSPVQLNYWHMTLDTYLANSENYINGQTKLGNAEKKLLSNLKKILIEKLRINTEVEEIEEEDYSSIKDS